MNVSGKSKKNCNSCCVPGCKSNSTPSFRNRGGRITTFKLPRNEKRRKEWIQAIPRRKYPPTVNHNVCILHFNEEDFSRNNRRIDLKKSAVPSIFPFVNGQRNDDNSDVNDEVWLEYMRHRTELLGNGSEDKSEDLPTASTSDISRILIERLRIPGSKYFGINTDVIIDPDSDIESDVVESKSTIKVKKSPKNRKEKVRNRNSKTSIVKDSSRTLEENSSISPMLTDDNTCVSKNEEEFGAMVSSKLSLMSPMQRLISQKIISEIVLKGQLNLLQSSSHPVVVSGYTKNKFINPATDCSISLCDSDDTKDGDCDPLMFLEKQKMACDENVETFTEADGSWSDSD
ncbi:hypothetical protein Bhyg_05917 [Pseudolycoriella hygida]|uniref:THAP-type domain-containing protein n=1 Tax=Pseudolycoriella hygida TaxID=35572 RepID=A0A9Q0MZV3_9DIPT|nr:hypothetical protein Bhyg_05917 [Pseudolycoriella hygida]